MHRLPLMAAEEDVVGLDVSDGIVSVARVGVRQDGAMQLRNAGWTEYAAGATDRELADAIRRVWRMAGLVSHTISAAFRSPSIVLRYFKYPALSREEFESALRIEAEESLQLPQNEILLDWHLNESAPSAAAGPTGSRPCEGLLAAAPAKEVQRFMATLRMAGLYPVVLDIGAAALGNLFRAMHRESKAPQDACVIHLTRQHADIAVLFQRCGIYARTISARSGDWASSLDYLAESVSEALRFYEFKLRHPPVRRVFVAGRVPAMADFVDRFGRQAGASVEVWDPLAHVIPASSRVRRLINRREVVPPMVISMGLALRRYDGA